MATTRFLGSAPGRARRIFANRTLNLRAIRAVGYDMDYTLVHYKVGAWEARAYEHARQRILDRGWSVEQLEFDPELAIRGLVIDTELGNVVKANRFGFIRRAYHGTRLVDFEEQRLLYARTIVDLAEPRWAFLNTLFSLSEACLFMQLVDLLDARRLPGSLGYADLYRVVRESIDAAHMGGLLKAEILQHPDRFVVPDPDIVLTLLDQRAAGKKLLLITNSEWAYTSRLMSYAFEAHLPKGTGWRDLFDLVVVGANKPHFFSERRTVFEIANDEGLLRPTSGKLVEGRSYYGGDASIVESHLGLSADEILYVGDHIWGDVAVSKSVLRWRTALVLRELEEEVEAIEAMQAQERLLSDLMVAKERCEEELCVLRIDAQRQRARYGPSPTRTRDELAKRMAEIREELASLEVKIVPLAKALAEVSNRHWGLLMRAGNDKSHLAKQVERSADIYTSRVSNFLAATPYAFLRAPRTSLPHEPVVQPPASEEEAHSGRV